MTHPSFQKHKRYIVLLDRPLEPLHQQMISDFGVMLPDGKSQLILTHYDGDNKVFESSQVGGAKKFSNPSGIDRLAWYVEMSEGRNRQIRRTFAALGYLVVFLQRIEFDSLKLEPDLKIGGYKEIQRPS